MRYNVKESRFNWDDADPPKIAARAALQIVAKASAKIGRVKDMHSFLIISKQEDKIKETLEKLYGEFLIDRLDVTVVETEKSQPATAMSIGIADIRKLQKKLLLKPIKSPTKAAVIEHAQNLTIEAQNALLKMLEEPPKNTIIILTAPSTDPFLPTVVSRCKVMFVGSQAQTDLSNEELHQYTSILVYLQSGEVGKKLEIAQEVGKNRETALEWLEKMIIVARKNMIKSFILRATPPQAGKSRGLEQTGSEESHSAVSSGRTARTIRLFQKFYLAIKTTNVSPRLALENLFFSL